MKKVRVIIFPFIPDHFSITGNAINFFIHSSNRFVLKKNAYALLVFFNRVPYIQLSYMIPGVNIIDRKVNVASVNRAGGVWGCSETLVGPLRKFLGSKEHLNWLKIDLNAAEIISIQDYKQT